MDLPHSRLRFIHDSFTNRSRRRECVRPWRAVCLHLTFGAGGTHLLALGMRCSLERRGRGRAGAGRSASSAQLPTAACPVLRRCHLAGVDWPSDGATDQRSASIDVIETMLPMDSGGRCSRPKMSACTRRCASHYPSCVSWQDAVAQCDVSAARRSGPAAPAVAGHAEGGGHAVIPGRARGRRACDLGRAALISCSGPCTSM